VTGIAQLPRPSCLPRDNPDPPPVTVLATSVELFRYRDAAKDGGTLEYLFEGGGQNSPNAVPFWSWRQEKSIWLDRGSTVASKPGCRGWVLHHVPAKTGSGVSGEESEATELLATYRPDYFVSGHDHAFPYTIGQSWNQKLDEMRLLVPGQLLSAPRPNYIKLDTESGELSWHTVSDTWIPEEGLHDHLVLKVTKD
jgi:hypothetical protein